MRGKRDVARTRRILRRVIEGALLKQVAFEFNTTVQYVSALRSRYIKSETSLTLNAKGERLMEVHEQLSLKLGDPNA